MTIIWLSVKEGTPARGYWDQRLLEEFFVDEKHLETNEIKPQKEAIVVIPGAYQADYIDEINKQLANLKKCTVIITSDEENNFPIDQLSHPNMRVFADYYNAKYTSEVRWMPIGPANTFDIPLPAKTRDFAFEGQVTHEKREKYIKEIRTRTDGVLIETQGFAQGDSPEDYFKFLATAKVVPSPEGNISPDAFRTWEAISAGAVPVPVSTEYHWRIFDKWYPPFVCVDNYEDVNKTMDWAIGQYPTLNNVVQMWWLQQKRKLKQELIPSYSEITVLIPCSPIKSHPSTEIIDETIKSIRSQLPDSEIIITFDGVRGEQEDRRAKYEEFKRRLLWKIYHDPEYKNILPLNFETHSHQVKMAREALKYVTGDLILYCEQDTPVTPDVEIDWEKCEDLIYSGEANLIRFHFEAQVPEPHKHMMVGEVEDGFLRTVQWSQRPHLASKAYYARILGSYFSPDAVCFIEDKMHGIVHEAWIIDGMNGWYQHRLWIYHPDGNIKRSYHTDGRAGEEKWDNTQTW
jgi:hypothetical protein